MSDTKKPGAMTSKQHHAPGHEGNGDPTGVSKGEDIAKQLQDNPSKGANEPSSGGGAPHKTSAHESYIGSSLPKNKEDPGDHELAETQKTRLGKIQNENGPEPGRHLNTTDAKSPTLGMDPRTGKMTEGHLPPGPETVDLVPAGGVKHDESPGDEFDTVVKLGSIDESKYVTEGARIVAVNRASGEITIRGRNRHGRSTQSK